MESTYYEKKCSLGFIKCLYQNELLISCSPNFFEMLLYLCLQHGEEGGGGQSVVLVSGPGVVASLRMHLHWEVAEELFMPL